MTHSYRLPETEELPFAGPSPDPLLGQLAGRFRLVRHLATGGMGIVYAAEHIHLKFAAAIKLLAWKTHRTQAAVQQFQREAELLASLRHPGVVQVLDYGELLDGRPYLAMELLEGETLAARLGCPLPRTRDLTRELSFALQAATTLAWLHEAGLAHRDIKPSNVFIVKSAAAPLVKLLDFGLAESIGRSPGLTRAEECSLRIWGTRPYLAPELCTGSQAEESLWSGKVDVYALGVVLYELCCGGLPPDSGGGSGAVLAGMRAAVSAQTGLTGLPLLVDGMLAQRPEQRLAMTEVVARLTGLCQSTAQLRPACSSRWDRCRGSLPAQLARRGALGLGLALCLAFCFQADHQQESWRWMNATRPAPGPVQTARSAIASSPVPAAFGTGTAAPAWTHPGPPQRLSPTARQPGQPAKSAAPHSRSRRPFPPGLLEL